MTKKEVLEFSIRLISNLVDSNTIKLDPLVTQALKNDKDTLVSELDKK